MEAAITTANGLTGAEAILVDVAGLVARGRAADVPRRLKRMLGKPELRRGEILSPACQRMLRETLAGADDPGRRRRARGAAAPEAAEELTASPGDSLAALPRHDDEVETVRRPALSAIASARIDRLVREHADADKLIRRGLAPTNSLLLTGPPGVGKTMTAVWLAQSVGRPLVRVEPVSTMSSLLGESARRFVAQVQAAKESDAVLLIDEIDALAKHRDDPQEVGEHKRLVTTVLLELDRWPADRLLIAATNHPSLLDPALERRFELVVELGLPDDEQRRFMIKTGLEEFDVDVTASAVGAASELLADRSGALLTRVARDAARAHIMDDVPADWALVRACLPVDPSSLSRRDRVRIAAVAKECANMTSREIAPLLGVSHVTVQKLIRERDEEALVGEC